MSPTSVAGPPEATIVMTRVFDAPRALVWQAMTDPAHLAQWWGGPGFSNPVCELDLRPGGRWIVGFQVPDGPAFREDRILTTVERPRRIAYDLQVVQDGAPRFSTTVDVTIERVRGGHRICLAQQGFPTAELRDDFAGAWPDVLAELDRRVSGPVGAE